MKGNKMNRFKLSRRTLPIMAGFGAMTLVLAGCAAGSEAPAETTDAQAPSAAAAEPVQIGLISPLSGPFADNGLQARLGTELCTNQINEAGGIKSLGGAQIELIIQDTGPAAPADVANQLQSMIDKNDLSAVIGAWASSYTLAAAPIAEQNQIPMITESFADAIVEQGYKYIFKLPASAALMGSMATEAILDLANEQGIDISTAAVVADNTSAAQVSAEAAQARFISLGVDVPVTEFFTPGLTTADSIAIKVLASEPQVIFIQGSLGDMAILQRAFRDQGYDGPLLGAGSGFVTVDYANTIGISETNGTFSSAGWNWDMPGDAAAKFKEDFVAAYPEYEFPGQEAGEDCAAVYIIAQAMEEAGSSDPSVIRDAISNINIVDGPATMLASGKVSFDETGMLEDTTPVIIQWQDGIPRTVFPKSIASTDPIALK
jgi:branched-chain amino acid transport system substrate-binding protein